MDGGIEVSENGPGRPAERRPGTTASLVGAAAVLLVQVLAPGALPDVTAQAMCVPRADAVGIPHDTGPAAGNGNPRYPENESTLHEMVRRVDVDAQRDHAWLLFSRITQSSVTGDPRSPPIFATWHDASLETFADPPDGCARNAGLLLETPTQALLEHLPASTADLMTASPRALLATGAEPPSAPVGFSSVAFSPTLHAFLREGGYYRRATFQAQADPKRARRLLFVDPPGHDAASVKMAWWPAAADALTPLPVYDPADDPRSETEAYPPVAWPRVVVVDPSGTHQAPSRVHLAGRDYQHPKLVGLDRFYHVLLDQAGAARANDRSSDRHLAEAAKTVLGRPLRQGDLLLLVGMHLNTREFRPWVFTTYWWHDRPDEGDAARRRPDSVRGVWRNYLMGTAYNINTPREPDGSALVVFNPYIELHQRGGSRSGCMDCHARATWSDTLRHVPAYQASLRGSDRNNGYSPDRHGIDDEIFRPGTVDLDTMWTLFVRNRAAGVGEDVGAPTGPGTVQQ